MSRIKIYTLYSKNFKGKEKINSEFFFKDNNSISKDTISILEFSRINIRYALLL